MTRNLAIVPAHNEVEAIASTIAAIHRWAPDFDIVVIDDGYDVAVQIDGDGQHAVERAR